MSGPSVKLSLILKLFFIISVSFGYVNIINSSLKKCKYQK